MAWKSFCLNILLIAVLGSCATVGDISGGPKDVFAPKPLDGRSLPSNGSTSVSPSLVEIELDEYFKLVSPNENITISPADVSIESKIDKKKLQLHLKGKLRENTTYQIVLANAVADLNENNDSLMTYVFSTGNTIDSLSYEGRVKDNYTAEPGNNFTVGLFLPEDSLQRSKAQYLTRSDKEGVFHFTYLKAGKYRVFGFQDKNKNRLADWDEAVFFSDSLLNINQNKIDSNYFLSFVPAQDLKIRTKIYEYPAKIILGANGKISEKAWFVNGSLLGKAAVFSYTQDSLSFCLPFTPKERFFITSEGIDTIEFQWRNQTGVPSYEILPKEKELTSSRSVTLIFNDSILGIDSDLFNCIQNDSLRLMPRISYEINRLIIHFDTKPEKNLSLKLQPGALKFRSLEQKDTISADFKVRELNEFGSFVFAEDTLNENFLLEILKSGKVYKTITSDEFNKEKRLDFVEAGEYTFRLIEDADLNGKYSPGSLKNMKQGEKVIHFPQSVKVRANWETEINLF